MYSVLGKSSKETSVRKELMLMLDDLPQFLREVEAVEREMNKAAGARDQMKKELKSKFGLSKLSEIKKALRKMEEEVQQEAEEWTEKFKRYKKEFAEVLKQVKEEDD